MKICGIYKITSPSNKVYIGQSVDIVKRFAMYRGLHCKHQTILYNSLQKHGVEKHNFEILCQCDKSELDKLEVFYIDLFQCFNSEHGLNIKSGGTNGYSHSEETKKKISISNTGKGVGWKHTEEAKQRIGEASKGNKYSVGRKSTNETRLKQSASLRGRIVTEETKQKISLKNKGRVPPKYVIDKAIEKNKGNTYRLGKKMSDEVKLKMSNSKKGKLLSEETKNKLSEYHLKIKMFAKKVIDTKTGIIYNSAKDAAEANGIKHHTLCCMLNGQNKNKTTLKYYEID